MLVVCLSARCLLAVLFAKQHGHDWFAGMANPNLKMGPHGFTSDFQNASYSWGIKQL
jgi:hypothetical protein